MSEERPNFKVTDRRLFNTDGTPRDVQREDAPSNDSAPAFIVGEGASAAGAPGPTTAPEVRPNQPPTVDSDIMSGAAAGEEAEPDGMLDEMGDESFVNLVMFIASPAAAALGLTEHPGMAGRGIDLPLAKHCIDLLGTLRDKTRGTLSAQEGQLLEGLLAELRMQYVSLTSARPSPAGPRGFTGGDITGGR